MKEIWRRVKFKNFTHYRVSNYGNVINTKNDNFIFGTVVPNGKIKMFLKSKKNIKRIMLHILVLTHFKPQEIKECGIHIDYDYNNNKIDNLEWATLGEAIAHGRRRNNELNNTPKGVYFYSRTIKKQWRAVLSTGKGVAKTLGYFSTKQEAVEHYQEEYFKLFKRWPYTIQEKEYETETTTIT